MPNSLLRRRSLCSALALLTTTQIYAQTVDEVYVLDEYTVSSGPLAREVSDFSSPFSSLNEEAIRREGGGTLGELLSSQSGVHATSFGAGASRPIIRGFDGPRVRILDSAIESTDVSNTSPDHAVAVEPLLVDRVEIIRGPATLLYGSSAIGGVVNVIGKEIPRARPPESGFEGAFESRYDSVSDGETFLGYGTAGVGNLALSITGLTRDSDDYEIPVAAEADESGGSGHLDNSFVETDAVSAGGTYFFGERNYFGAAFSLYESLYGVPGHDHGGGGGGGGGAHEDVTIDLQRIRFHNELVVYEPVDWIEAARMRFGYTDYEHTEFEGDEKGTIFKREGWELRAEASHHAWALSDEGVIGLQFNDSDFEAIGDEAFAPASTTTNKAVFLSEHIHRGEWHFEYGGRIERQDAKAEGHQNDYEDIAYSLAGGIIWSFADHQSLALSLQRSERHPEASELYARGPHLATSQYEIGDPDLELEKAYGVDLSYRYNSAEWTGSLTLFYTYFDDYIFAENLGFETDPEGRVLGDAGFDAAEALDTYQYTAVDASFWGVEAELYHILYATGDTKLSVGLIGDFVEAENRNNNDSLPRIPPLRLGARANLEKGLWSADLLLRRAFDQSNNAPGETETGGYTELRLNLQREIELSNGLRLTAFARGNNLLDDEIRHHTSFLKDEAPMPGRSILVGARVEF